MVRSETGLMLSWLCFLPGLPGGRATAGPGGRESCNMSYAGSGGSLHGARGNIINIAPQKNMILNNFVFSFVITLCINQSSNSYS